MKQSEMAEPRQAPDEDTTVDVGELTEWTGETAEGIEVFVSEGVLRPDAEGRFPLIKSCQAIIKYWQSVIDMGEAGGNT